MKRITIARGDGIGPEIMDATLRILFAAGAQILTEEIEIGEQVYLRGNSSGIAPEAWDVIRRNKIFLKAPITTPQGGGFKSLNVSTRKFLGLYANVRPCFSLHPQVATKHPLMDVVIIRENEEDVYAGIEHQQTDEVVQCLKLISRPGCEKIIRYAFEYAQANGRKKVSCFTKDNIMKQTDGLFRKVFEEIAAEYPNLEHEHWIVDIGAAKLADTPELFDVVVLPNLYGDVLSDVAAQIAGSVGMAGSSNIGESCAMFEAIHGSAPRRAGQNAANPSGLLQGAVLMLEHIGQWDVANKIQNAWLRTLEDGIHTYDLFQEGISTTLVGTSEFADAVIQRLGKVPSQLRLKSARSGPIELKAYQRAPSRKKVWVGADVFLHWRGSNPNELAELVHVALHGTLLKLEMITNRGILVYPNGFPETFCTDHWRCRLTPEPNAKQAALPSALTSLTQHQLDWIKLENLYEFDGQHAYSRGQGQ